MTRQPLVEILHASPRCWVIGIWNPDGSLRHVTTADMDDPQQLAVVAFAVAYHAPSLTPQQVGQLVGRACSPRSRRRSNP